MRRRKLKPVRNYPIAQLESSNGSSSELEGQVENCSRQGYNTVLQGYRAQFGIFEKIESRAIGPTYKITKILFISIERNKLFYF